MMYIAHDVDIIPTKIMHAIGVEQPASAGIGGGFPSCTNQFVLKRDSNIEEILAQGDIPQSLEEVEGKLEVATGITPTYQKKGDVYHCIGMGGGGYGDPLARDPERVFRDVVNGLVTTQGAEDYYGVVIRPHPWRVDSEASQIRRDAIRSSRASCATTRSAGLKVKGISQ